MIAEHLLVKMEKLNSKFSESSEQTKFVRPPQLSSCATNLLLNTCPETYS